MEVPHIYQVHGISGDSHGYYRHPALRGDRLIFVSEDDLWTLSVTGGVARRLTAARGRVTSPAISPDGNLVAYTSTEHGCPEIFVMPAQGGSPEKLTYSGAISAQVCGWSRDGEYINFRSTLREPFSRTQALYRVAREGGEIERLPIGQAHHIAYDPNGEGAVLARYSDDRAYWKRYRGGRAGQLWIDREGTGQWKRFLPEIEAGLVRPMWIDDRIFFITDEEGVANLHSCKLDGTDWTRHTDHEQHYVRFACHDGDFIVYTAGAALYRYELGAGTMELIDVDYPSPRAQRKLKFVDAEEFLHDFALHPKGHSLAVTSRGKVFNFGNWEGAVRQTGQRFGVRYRLATHVGDGEQLLVVSDEGGEEYFEIHDTDGDAPKRIIDTKDVDIGRPIELEVSPQGNRVLFTNERFQLLYLDLSSEDCVVIDESPAKRIAGICWAPDNRHVAYGYFLDQSLSTIKIADVDGDERRAVTSGRFCDEKPVFDPRGRYLYFLSYRDLDPVMDQVYFDLGFPEASKPCAITLDATTPSPFVQRPRPLDGAEDEKDDASHRDSDPAMTIDFDKIEKRVEFFPVPSGNYEQIGATEERVFWTVFPTEKDFSSCRDGTLKYWDLESGEVETFAGKVSHFTMDRGRKTLALWADDELRVVAAGGEGIDDDHEERGRKSGIVDLQRVVPAVDPRAEWCQMLREAWRLMRDHFWRDDMGGIDWEAIWDRYKALLPRVSTRSEFSDLVWTMQGELGTSHAYEVGGDYEIPPQYQPGFLGADLKWDHSWRLAKSPQRFEGAFRIERILEGDPWDKKSGSPLLRPGTEIDVGDVIVAVNGQKVRANSSMGQLLAAQARREVELLVASEDGKGPLRSVTVETIESEQPLRYRQWVALNRQVVHEATDSRIGYVHIPDMGPGGYAEFHRQYLHEHSRRALIVDVRVNGGGFVSQLILEKLARKPLGVDLMRHGRIQHIYPAHAVNGPLVALTDSSAGSDGDIFSHCFKLMKLGPLIGTRTWGGTIGIWPRHELVDGSITTQPEFAFWFEDVGFGLENRGAEPDIVVDFPPNTPYGSDDPQLREAIDQSLRLLKTTESLRGPEK